MKVYLALSFLALFFLVGLVFAKGSSSKIFPYKYEVKDLANGLRVIVAPTDFPNIVSLQIPVHVGSRNEVEPGKSGFAHFFEHMMFRGTEKYSTEKYNDILKEAGADGGGYTSDDYTNYYITCSKDFLETAIMLEADRFQNLKYSIENFKTESRAVLGEYNMLSSRPTRKMLEVQRNAAYSKHTYKHTVVGFLKDIQDMPNQYDYSLTFFKRFYRPDNITIIVTGDVNPKQVFKLVEKYWGKWKKETYKVDIPQETEHKGPIYDHVKWDTPTLPLIFVSFHGPAFSETKIDKATMDIIAKLAFSESSPLYQKLVVKEQKVDFVEPYFQDTTDPYLLDVIARVKDKKDIWYVRDEILKTFASLRTDEVSPKKLSEIKSNLKYSFANGLNSSKAISDAVVYFAARSRDLETINRVYNLFDKITAKDIKEMANKYFTDKRLVVVTLSQEDLPKIASKTNSIDKMVAKSSKTPPKIETVLLPNNSPLIDFRILFNVGSSLDPKGKEGLATLTALMISDAGSKSMKYDEIKKAMLPIAAGFGAQIDKEMTVFIGKTHKDNLTAYYEIIKEMLINPGWGESDFSRLKKQLINAVKVSLRSNNDEELGKEVLYEFIYDGHPYSSLNYGHIKSLESITLDDVKEFYKKNYTRMNLVLGLAGDYGKKILDKSALDLGNLPLGSKTKIKLTKPEKINGLEVMIVKKEARAVAISFGFPIEINRSHKDFAALWLARSYFGEHRSSNGLLMQKIRGARGMNYGDYAYIEYFPQGMFTRKPDPNLGRQQQIFQVWLRPLQPEQAHFALRIAMHEFDKLLKKGLSKKDFELTRNFLSKYVDLLTATQSRQLGYLMDSKYYNIGEFTKTMKKNLAKLTLKDVNRAINKYLQKKNIKFVFIAKDAEKLRDQLINNTPSPMTYDAKKPEELLAEDKKIEKYKLNFRKDKVRIVKLEDVFLN